MLTGTKVWSGFDKGESFKSAFLGDRLFYKRGGFQLMGVKFLEF